MHTHTLYNALYYIHTGLLKWKLAVTYLFRVYCLNAGWLQLNLYQEGNSPAKSALQSVKEAWLNITRKPKPAHLASLFPKIITLHQQIFHFSLPHVWKQYMEKSGCSGSYSFPQLRILIQMPSSNCFKSFISLILPVYVTDRDGSKSFIL